MCQIHIYIYINKYVYIYNVYKYIYMLAPPKIYFLHPFVCPKFYQKAFCIIKKKNQKTIYIYIIYIWSPPQNRPTWHCSQLVFAPKVFHQKESLPIPKETLIVCSKYPVQCISSGKHFLTMHPICKLSPQQRQSKPKTKKL